MGGALSLVMCLGAHLVAGHAAAQCQPVLKPLLSQGLGEALTVFDEDGDGPAPPMLFAGGAIRRIGIAREEGWAGIEVGSIARLDGWNWYPMGEGFGPAQWHPKVNALIGLRIEGNPGLTGLFAGGSNFHLHNPHLSGIARWNGQTWGAVGGGADDGPFAFSLFDEPDGNTVLMAAGLYRIPGVWNRIYGLGRWDGIEWTEVGGGLWSSTPGRPGAGLTLTIFDEDGPGGKPPALFVGGSFIFAGDLEVRNIARWDGREWSTVGGLGAIAGPVTAMCVFDDGNGPQLYVGGSFREVGGPPGEWIPAFRLARWDGKRWSAVPGWGVAEGQVSALAVFDDDGPGPNKPALFVGGNFWNNPNIPGSWNLVKWDGQTWEALPQVTGLAGGWVHALQPYDDDHDGPNPGGLYVAGQFLFVGNERADGLARWGCPLTPPCLADCDFSTGFGVLDVFDFLCFANRFHAGAPYACDCDTSTGHGVCDIFDFLCFGQRFQRGCD